MQNVGLEDFCHILTSLPPCHILTLLPEGEEGGGGASVFHINRSSFLNQFTLYFKGTCIQNVKSLISFGLHNNNLFCRCSKIFQ